MIKQFDDKLRNCPFCGAFEPAVHKYEVSKVVQCAECGAQANSTAWENRVENTELKRLRDKIALDGGVPWTDEAVDREIASINRVLGTKF